MSLVDEDQAGDIISRGVDFLQAHVMSLVLDADKIDQKALQKLYARRRWVLPTAIAWTQKANKLLDRKAHKEAIEAYEKALAICDSISAAHNGLAWTLLTANDPKLLDAAKALKHAETAVKQTEQRDSAALDTLALAYFKNDKKKEAVEAIKKAIEIDPKNEDLKKQPMRFAIL